MYIFIGIGIIIIIGFFVYLKKKQDELEDDFKKRFSGKNILLLDKHAEFIAQESDGFVQVRGLGYLVFTDEVLFFQRQLGNKIVLIPIHSIVQAGETRRLGGRSPGRTMLQIKFKDNSGKNDSIALLVKELSLWKKVIAGAIDKKT